MVVSDSGVLISLAAMDLIKYLPRLFEISYIPQEVVDECTKDSSRRHATAIDEAIKSRTLIVRNPKTSLLELSLDKGETAAITLASELNCRILIDERKGRLIAKEMKLRVGGSLSVLLKCKEYGLISTVSEKLDLLAVHDYYISKKLKIHVLKKAGEI